MADYTRVIANLERMAALSRDIAAGYSNIALAAAGTDAFGTIRHCVHTVELLEKLEQLYEAQVSFVEPEKVQAISTAFEGHKRGLQQLKSITLLIDEKILPSDVADLFKDLAEDHRAQVEDYTTAAFTYSLLRMLE